MQDWLGNKIVINGGDSSYGFGGAAWNRLDVGFYFISAEIDNYTPGQQNTYDLNQVHVEFDGTVSSSRQVGSGLVTTGNPFLFAGLTVSNGNYRIFNTNEAANGYELYTTSTANLPASALGSPVKILDDYATFGADLRSVPVEISEMSMVSYFGSYYAVAWIKEISPTLKIGSFQGFNASTGARFSSNAINIRSLDNTKAIDISTWNSSRIVVVTDKIDEDEGNIDLHLTTYRVDTPFDLSG